MKEIVNFSSSVKLQWLMLSTWSLIRYHWSPFLKVRHLEVGTNMVGCLSIHSTCYNIKTEAPQLSAKGHQYLCWYLQYLHIKSNLWFAVLKEIQVACNSKGNRRVNTSSKTYYIPLSWKYNQINSKALMINKAWTTCNVHKLIGRIFEIKGLQSFRISRCIISYLVLSKRGIQLQPGSSCCLLQVLLKVS